jgi:hypothetical protein
MVKEKIRRRHKRNVKYFFIKLWKQIQINY